MKAAVLGKRAPVETQPLEITDVPSPNPGEGELLIQVEACGVCRTDLHVVEGDLPARKTPVIPGHQAVGKVVELGKGAASLKIGDRVGVPWLYSSCGVCRYCQLGSENLCDKPRFTGYDADGGYAQFISAREDFVYRLPEGLDPIQAAPLLCAGIIGYRALRRSGTKPKSRLGLYGFGASAHVVIQIALFWGCEVYVATRAESHRRLALSLGAAWAGGLKDRPPRKLDAAILFAPAGELVPLALESLDKGGTLAIAGIHLTDIPPLSYSKHLFEERGLQSVTANTRQDGRELLELAREIPLKPKTQVFPLKEANEALRRLKTDGIDGAAVLKIG